MGGSGKAAGCKRRSGRGRGSEISKAAKGRNHLSGQGGTWAGREQGRVRVGAGMRQRGRMTVDRVGWWVGSGGREVPGCLAQCLPWCACPCDPAMRECGCVSARECLCARHAELLINIFLHFGSTFGFIDLVSAWIIFYQMIRFQIFFKKLEYLYEIYILDEN